MLYKIRGSESRIHLPQEDNLPSKFTESAPISERLFDPQYYATLSAMEPLSRTGYLQEEYACYFAPRRYDQLLKCPPARFLLRVSGIFFTLSRLARFWRLSPLERRAVVNFRFRRLR